MKNRALTRAMSDLCLVVPVRQTWTTAWLSQWINRRLRDQCLPQACAATTTA